MKNLLIILLLSIGVTTSYSQNIISIEAKGNLESPKPLLCVDLLEVTNENNPADILSGMKKCMEIKDFKNAARLFAISGVYGKFDTYRVKDKSAHQALIALQLGVVLDIDEADKKLLFKNINDLLSDKVSLNEICETIQKIGIPKYYPKYMIQHGIQAFIDTKGDDLIEGFDCEKSWALALKNYLHCGE